MIIAGYYLHRRPAKDAQRILAELGLEEKTAVSVYRDGRVRVAVDAAESVKQSAASALARATHTIYSDLPRDGYDSTADEVERYIGIGCRRFREGGNQHATGIAR